ncbi:hypothetical protein ACOMHN_024773 [Nucella lapillus]
MVGMIGASGMFSGVFFYTPELFPTNIRNQALGLSSFTGRLGGMLAPFMVDLEEIAVWAPGALIGSLCFLVMVLVHFLPETRGRELPNTVHDIEIWYSDQPHHTTTTTTTTTAITKAQRQRQKQQQKQQQLPQPTNGTKESERIHTGSDDELR